MEYVGIILIAAAVAALSFAVANAIGHASLAPKRRLQQRLTSSGRFESSATTQGMRLLDRQDGAAGNGSDRRGPAQWLRRRLGQTFPSCSTAKFVAICAALAMVLAGPAWVITEHLGVTIVAGLAGAYLPLLVVLRKRASWQNSITNQLPEALDFLSRVLRAGQSLSTGLQMMSEELPQPLSGEFRRCYDQHGLGQSLDDGLRDMAIRLESQEFAFFVTAVIIQRQSGGDLAEVLQNISRMIRQRLQLHQSVRAKTAEGRLTGYVMVAFPVVMFGISYALNPQRAGMLLHTSQGHALTAVATGLVLAGLFLIKRITTVRV